VYGYSTGVMIAPLQAEFGWSRTQISSGPAVVAIVGVVLSPFMGMAIDRFGPRQVALVGVVLVSVALAMLSATSGNIWSWRVHWFLLSIAGLFVTFTVWTSAIARLFNAARGIAMAVAMCGVSIGALITPMMAYVLVEQFGWRLAYIGLAASWGALAATLVYFF